MMNKENRLKKGYADEAVDKGIDLRKEIKKLHSFRCSMVSTVL